MKSVSVIHGSSFGLDRSTWSTYSLVSGFVLLAAFSLLIAATGVDWVAFHLPAPDTASQTHAVPQDRRSVGSTPERRKRASSSPLDWHTIHSLYGRKPGLPSYLDMGRPYPFGIKGEIPLSVLQKVPARLDQLRPGMTEYEFWETLGLIEYWFGGGIQGVLGGGSQANPWASYDLGAGFGMTIGWDNTRSPPRHFNYVIVRGRGWPEVVADKVYGKDPEGLREGP